MISEGKFEKMKIKAYTDATYANLIEEPSEYEVLLNPETFSNKYQIDVYEEQAPGNSGAPVKYCGQLPNEWEFDILIDGTGVVKTASVLDISVIGAVETISVKDEVEKFKRIVYDYNGAVHRNNCLIITWGEYVFKGSLISLDLNYKLFNSNGTPLRVIAKIRLKEWVDPALRVIIEDSASPDMTHERTYKAGDKFTLMTEKIYNEPGYYIDVAGLNGLSSFRKISIGTKLKFPPLK